MKNMYFFLFAFLFFGISQSFAQASRNSDETGGNAKAAPAVGLTVNVKRAPNGAATTVPADNLKSRDRKGVRFQLLDASGKLVKGGEKRIRFSETDGNVEVDVAGLPAAPKGKSYRLRVTGADNKSTDVDIK